ncbi:MAG TPA: DUF3352 domain-containing protein [Mycobacteriales bacterium]|nr:DUF3352 domain-containing protein [Mycobacteriales bacterium]
MPPPRRRRRGLLVTAGVVIAALAISGGAYAVVSSGGGDNADAAIDELPSTAVAAGWVSLHPGGGQEKAALHTLHQLDASISESGSIKDNVLSQVLDNAGQDYDKDIKPWLGDHAGVAAIPQDGDLTTVGAIQVTDKDKAEAFLKNRSENEGFSGEYQFDGDYAIVGESKDIVQQAIKDIHAGNLSKNDAYNTAIKGLDGKAMGMFWADAKAMKPFAEKQGTNLPPWTPTSMALSFTFQDNYLDVQVSIKGGPKIASDNMGARIAKLPGDTTTAIGATGLDKGVKQLAQIMQESPAGARLAGPLSSLSYRTGIEDSDQLATLLGSRTILTTGPGLSTIGFISKSDDPDQTKEELDGLAQNISGGLDFTTKQTDEGTIFASSPGYADKLAAKDGDLGSQEGYRTAVPDAADANVVIYANLDAYSQIGGQDMPKQLKNYRSFGLTCTFGSDGTTHARMRLVTK